MAPRFCTNPHCSLHFPHASAGECYFKKNGTHYTQVVGSVQRYKCRLCGKTFSDRSFSIDYWTRKTLDYLRIHRATSEGESVSAVARSLGCSWESVQNRIGRLARNVVALHASLNRSRSLQEDLVADGLEGFDVSKYFPSHVTILTGESSQYIYSISHMNFSRKGAMTSAQRARKKELAKKWKTPRGALKKSFAKAMQVIPEQWDRRVHPKLVLKTDLHPVYPKALRSIPELAAAMDEGSFEHQRYSSLLPRDATCPLFAANYIDRLVRKDAADYARQSSCDNRNSSSDMYRCVIYAAWHNYEKRFRIRPKSEGERCLHAEKSGISGALIAAGKAWLYRDRAFLSHQMLKEWEEDIWLRRFPTPLKARPDYLQKHASDWFRASTKC